MSDFYDYLDHLSDDAKLNSIYMKNWKKLDPSLYSPAVMSGRTLPPYIPSTDREVVPDLIWDSYNANNTPKPDALDIIYYALHDPSKLSNDQKKMLREQFSLKNTNKPIQKTELEQNAGNANTNVNNNNNNNNNNSPDTPANVGTEDPKTPNNANNPPTGTNTGTKGTDKKDTGNAIGNSVKEKVNQDSNKGAGTTNVGTDTNTVKTAEQIAYDRARNAANTFENSAIIQDYSNKHGINKQVPQTPNTPQVTKTALSEPQRDYYRYLTGYHRMSPNQAILSMGLDPTKYTY